MPSWPGTARTDGDVAGVAGRRPGMTVAEAVDGLPRRVASWGAAMSLAPTSLTGISLALGVCAAVWFTAGSTLGYAAGALALSGSYLAGRPAPRLAAGGEGRQRPPARPGLRSAHRVRGVREPGGGRPGGGRPRGRRAGHRRAGDQPGGRL